MKLTFKMGPDKIYPLEEEFSFFLPFFISLFRNGAIAGLVWNYERHVIMPEDSRNVQMRRFILDLSDLKSPFNTFLNLFFSNEFNALKFIYSIIISLH